MPITVNEGGTLYELDTVHSNEGGTLYELDTVHSNEGGTLYEIHGAWKPPTLTWKETFGGTATINSSNNGYNCTITRASHSNHGQRFDFTLSKPTRFTVTLDNWTGVGPEIGSPILLQSYSLDEGGRISVDSSTTNSFSIDVTDVGSHYISIAALGSTVIFTVTAEKI